MIASLRRRISLIARTVIGGWLLLPSIQSPGYAQPFVREIESIPVIMGGAPVALPWAGGINVPHHQFVDIDGDGDFDLFVMEKDNNGRPYVDFYRNEGSAAAPDFKLRPGLIEFPSFNIWFVFLDITNNGLYDLFTDDHGTGVAFYLNTGTVQSPQFTLHSNPMLDSAGVPVFAGSYSIPGFADIDGNGLIDFFSCNVDGTVNFYRNIGVPSMPAFRFVTPAWQNLLIFSTGACGGTRDRPVRHGACSLFFADIDGDGDKDLIWGDAFHNSLYLIRNDGTPQSPAMVLADTCWPPNDHVLTFGGNQPMLVDIDGDGDLDLFVAVGVVSGAIVQRGSFLFYENVGSPSSPLFVKRTNDFISTLDVGRNAQPVFADIDGDGKPNMIVGNTNGQLWHFKNTGTLASPLYELIDTAFGGVTGGFIYAPALVDIDGDGDLDLFVGLFDGRMRFYENIGTPTSPEFTRRASPVDTIQVPFYSVPAFVDIDGDGDYDLFVGQFNGQVKFYRNVGGATNFAPVLESTAFAGAAVGNNSKPSFTDLEGDGTFDLFIGAADGRLWYYKNVGTPTDPQFVLMTDRFADIDELRDSAPAFVDIDGDGDVDLFVGTLAGGIHFYRNNRITSVDETDLLPTTIVLHQNFPNPFNPVTTIRFSIPPHFDQQGYVAGSYITVRIHNVLGQDVATLVSGEFLPGEHEVAWDASNYPSGIYFCRLTVSPYGDLRNRRISSQQTRKLLLLK